MKELEFMELLGELPADYIEAASAPKPAPRRLTWLRYGVPAMAACIAVVILAAVYPRLRSPEIPSVGTEPAVSVVTASDDTEPDETVTTAADDTAGEAEAVPTGKTTSDETQTLTQSEASGQKDDEPASDQNAHTDREETNGEHTEKDKPQHTTAPTAGTKPRTTTVKAGTTARNQTTKVTAKTDQAEKSQPTTRVTVRTTSRVTTKPVTRPTTAPAVQHTTRVMTTATRAATTATKLRTEATSPYYTRPQTDAQYTSPVGWTNTDPTDKGTNDPQPTEPEIPPETEDPKVTESEVMKWQTYNPDPRSDELDTTWELLSERPGGDEYVNLDFFDFDRYDCLLIHLKTHATDAGLLELTISRNDVRISGMVYRQQYDPTQRHFMFAVAVPKNYRFDAEPDFTWEVTGDASDFYTTVERDPYIWIY